MCILIKCTTDRIHDGIVCTIPGTQLSNPCDSIKGIYFTQETLLLTDIPFQYSLPKLIP